MNRIKIYSMRTNLTIVAMIAMMLSASGAMSATLLSEDFESPVVGDDATVASYSKGTIPTGWIKATDGYGSADVGLNSIGTTQVISFRYTNTGLTSGAGAIGALKGNAVYRVTFEVAEDADPGETPYVVGFVVFNDGASRTDMNGIPDIDQGTAGVLASMSGDAPSGGAFATNTIVYTSSYANASAYVGKDLAVRLDGATTSANYDNITVETLSEDTTPPTIAPADIDSVTSVMAWSNITYTLTFDDWIPAHLLDVNTFTNVAATVPVTWDLISLSQVDSNVLALTLLPTTNGNLQLQITTNLLDAGLNNLATAVTDADTVTVAEELTPPTVTNIVDNANGGPVLESSIVTYTVYFDEPVDSNQVTTAVFEDSGTSGASINSVTALPAGVYGSYAPSYTVVVTAGSAGTMILQIKAAATIQDRAGNNLDTTLAVPDDTTINVVAPVTQAGTWIADQNGLWGHAANWQGSNVAYGADNAATFPNTITANRTVTLDRDITIGNIDFQETGQDLTISGTQTLTLDVTSGAPDISVSNRTLTISSVIAGTDGLTKSGAGTLTLSGVNTFTNDITISGGALTFSTLNAWGGSGKNVTFTGSGTLISTADGYVGGVLDASSGTASVGTASIDNGTLIFNSTTGSGTLIYNTRANKRLNIGNASGLTGTLLGRLVNNANCGESVVIQFSNIDDAAGSALQFQGGTGDSNQGYTIAFNGTSALTFNNRQVQILDRAAGNWEIRDNILANNSTDPAHIWVINTDLLYLGGRANTGAQTGRKFVLSGNNTGDNEFAGNITDGVVEGVPFNVAKYGTGRWILSGKNTYTGTTTVSGGTLVLRGEESISDTGTLNITSGKVEIETREAIAVLQINGTPVASGIWGTTASGAPNVDDTNLSGTGKLYVGEPFPPGGTVFIIK